jgi:hypothetical protein
MATAGEQAAASPSPPSVSPGASSQHSTAQHRRPPSELVTLERPSADLGTDTEGPEAPEASGPAVVSPAAAAGDQRESLFGSRLSSSIQIITKNPLFRIAVILRDQNTYKEPLFRIAVILRDPNTYKQPLFRIATIRRDTALFKIVLLGE